MTYSTSLKTTGKAIVWHSDASNSFAQDDPAALHHQIESVVKTLHSKGYQTTAFEHRHQVARQVAMQQPDILLIHLQTAGNAGYALCQQLKQQSDTGCLPIIFVGSRSEASERVQVLRCGGNAYLQLPVSSEELWLSLQQHLDTAKLVHQLKRDKISLSLKISEYSQTLVQQEQLKQVLTQENHALQKLAFVDGLTQVSNRRGFNQSIRQRWQEAYANQQPLSLLLCDIDYFKRYNDTYGHIAGDRCLRAVADALVRGTHRGSDQVARYGGEEFAIILPNTEQKGAQRVALSVQSEIARAQIPHEGSLIQDHISLSIGIFTLVPQNPQISHEVLVQGADEALYTAKLWGRDRAVISTDKGLLSLSANCCLCDYTQTSKAQSDTDKSPPPPATREFTGEFTKTFPSSSPQFSWPQLQKLAHQPR
ncbi:MAG: diguanylate cyclase [Cyanobacteria bacterium P01_F01_bin.3]